MTVRADPDRPAARLSLRSRLVALARRYGWALASCAYVFATAPVSSRSRGAVTALCNHLGVLPRRRVPTVDLSEIAPGDLVLEVREVREEHGNVSWIELVALNALVRSLNPRCVFEIGTFDGRTTLNLAANSPSEATIFTLDLPPKGPRATRLPLDDRDRLFLPWNTSERRYVGTDCEVRITQLLGDSATFDFSPFYGTIDFVFIDGSHSYQYVCHDTEEALRLLRPKGGTIAWHDYANSNWPGVTRALNEMYLSVPRLGGMRHIGGTSLAYASVGACLSKRVAG